MFEEDGSLDPMLKFILVMILVLTAARMLWGWITQDVPHWLGQDVGGPIAHHPWRTALIGVGALIFVGLVGRFVDWLFSADFAPYEEAAAPWQEEQEPAALTYRMAQFEAMTPTGFEQACADLLARDGFRRTRRVGGAGDLGADVLAWDEENRKLVVQCKKYAKPVGSQDMQRFNGTARPEHGADIAMIIGLNGFSQPATHFANRHRLTLIGRQELKRWAHGEHIYSVLAGHSLTP
ncbi:restriction endonuclease [Actinacidiphila sp. bgisy144]|uniref:restriction endonuclease n=1 Tax=Actinacidiphila sp. bgisy144 TaxID=3413791 RepID=UPI003EBEF995